MNLSPDPAAVLRKITWRLVPFLCLLYAFNILNRSNVGFARLTMEGDLQISEAASDWGYGFFYFGYLAFQLPANLLLPRLGARRWIAMQMVAWGLVSSATMAVTGAWSYCSARVLLGVAQAGFFPGIILYLTFWFPARERARITSLFMMAIPISGIFGNPLHGAIVDALGGAGGLKGWQWLLLLEGIPAVLLGFLVLFCLSNGPRQAGWLAEEERSWLLGKLAEEQQRKQRQEGDLSRALVDARVWLLVALYFSVAVGANAAGAHNPKLIKAQFAEMSPFEIGLLLALPHVCAIVAMTQWAAHSDRTGERRLHVAAAAFLAAAGWALSGLDASPWVTLIGLCLAQAGMMAMLPTFWAMPPSFLSGVAAAGGIALINSVANIGGLLGPRILGRFGVEAMAGTMALGGLLALCVRRDSPHHS